MQNKGYYAIQSHRGQHQSNIPICNFLLVINTNWHPTPYRFGVIAAYCSNFGHFAFLSPLWGLKNNIRCSSWAHWKVRSGLPTCVNWTFLYGIKIWTHHYFGLSQITRLTDGRQTEFSSLDHVCILCSMVKNVSPSLYNSEITFCHNSRVWQMDGRTDRQTDRRTAFSSLYRVCIPCSAVKTGPIMCNILEMVQDRMKVTIIYG